MSEHTTCVECAQAMQVHVFGQTGTAAIHGDRTGTALHVAAHHMCAWVKMLKRVVFASYGDERCSQRTRTCSARTTHAATCVKHSSQLQHGGLCNTPTRGGRGAKDRREHSNVHTRQHTTRGNQGLGTSVRPSLTLETGHGPAPRHARRCMHTNVRSGFTSWSLAP